MKTSYKALTQSRVAIKLEHRSTSWLRFLIRSLKSPTDNREERGWLRRIKKEAIVVLADERKLLLLLLNSFSTQLRSYFKGHFYYANEASCSHQVHKFWNQLGEQEEEFKVSKASSSSSEKLWVFSSSFGRIQFSSGRRRCCCFLFIVPLLPRAFAKHEIYHSSLNSSSSLCKIYKSFLPRPKRTQTILCVL